MGVDTQQATGLVGWVLQYGQIVGFFAQIMFWTVVAAMSVWAAMTFKRLVDHITGASAAKSAVTAEPVAVEEFVE